MTARPHATTIVGVRRGGTVAVGGDGQVTVGDVVMKHRAAKVRRLHHDTVLAGFRKQFAPTYQRWEYLGLCI